MAEIVGDFEFVAAGGKGGQGQTGGGWVHVLHYGRHAAAAAVEGAAGGCAMLLQGVDSRRSRPPGLC